MASAQVPASVLATILRELCSDEVKAICFIFRREHPGASSAEAVFEALCRRGMLTTALLATILLVLRRIDLLRTLCVSEEEAEQLLSVSPLCRYSLTVVSLRDDVEWRDLNGMAFLVRGHIPRSTPVECLLDLVIALEKAGLLEASRPQLLGRLLSQVGRVDLARRVSQIFVLNQRCSRYLRCFPASPTLDRRKPAVCRAPEVPVRAPVQETAGQHGDSVPCEPRVVFF
ncbi:FLIP [Equine molluscum contagiosum-like virus]|nr:FLIP [Equine molluscum contagiosum-like virus]